MAFVIGGGGRDRGKGTSAPVCVCVCSYSGSERSMEATSGVQGVKELFEDGTLVEYLEGDGDNTLIAKLRTPLDINMKKLYTEE